MTVALSKRNIITRCNSAKVLFNELLARQSIDEPISNGEYASLISELNDVIELGGVDSVTDELCSDLRLELFGSNSAHMDTTVVSPNGTVIINI